MRFFRIVSGSLPESVRCFKDGDKPAVGRFECQQWVVSVRQPTRLLLARGLPDRLRPLSRPPAGRVYFGPRQVSREEFVHPRHPVIGDAGEDTAQVIGFRPRPGGRLRKRESVPLGLSSFGRPGSGRVSRFFEPTQERQDPSVGERSHRRHQHTGDVLNGIQPEIRVVETAPADTTGGAAAGNVLGVDQEGKTPFFVPAGEQLAFVLNHWRDGWPGALLCVVSVMNLLWVAGIAVLVFAGKLLPGGIWIGRLGGGAMPGFGVLLLMHG